MVKVSKTILVQGAMMIAPGALVYALMNPNKLSDEELHTKLVGVFSPSFFLESIPRPL